MPSFQGLIHGRNNGVRHVVRQLFGDLLGKQMPSISSFPITFIFIPILPIALLGVLGLVSLSIQKRVKEIGVRKILGASNQNIVMLFVKEFMEVIIIASLIACPIAFFVINTWLNNYAYRIYISPLPFALAIVILVFITLLLIGFQAIKAAVVNNVKSLRTE
jgi:putative ABC transport system permease protein